MKKLLALAALVLGTAYAGVALAGPLVAPHLAFKQLAFRTHIGQPTTSQLTLANSGYDQMGFYVDSLTQQSTGSVFDTTAAFSFTGSSVIPPGGTSLDSSLSWVAFVSDAGNSSTATDSLYLQAQVSPDGRNWQAALCSNLGTQVALAYTANTAVNGTVFSSIEVGGTSSVAKIWMFRIGRVVPVAPTNIRLSPDVWHLHEWPYVRFVIRSVAGTGIWNGQAKIGYYSSDEDLNR